MKAFKATYITDSRCSEAQGVCDYYLPQVECDACGESWMDTEVWYPSLSLSPRADRSRFSRDVTVSIDELNALRNHLLGVKEKLRLLPGAGIGLVKAKLPKKSTDFVWCGFKLLASRRAVDVLEHSGVHLPYGSAMAQLGKETSHAYVALELDPVPLYDKKTLSETTLRYCEKCGSCEMQDYTANLKGLKRYLKKRMPNGQGLVRVYESTETLATEALIDVVQTKKLTGIDFLEDGIYV